MSVEKEEKMADGDKVSLLQMTLCKLHENLQAMLWRLQFLQTSYKYKLYCNTFCIHATVGSHAQ